MAVKYVKDFAFDSGFGFTGSKGATPVRAYMRGGAVKKVAPKAPSIAPAMVEKRSQGLGGLAKETKKLAAYDKPHMEGKKGAKVPQYAKGGAVKHPKKSMAKMMKKADGGDVASPEPMPPDGGRLVQAPPAGMMVNPNYGKPGQDYYIDINPPSLPSLPPGYEPPPLAGDDGGRNDFLRELVRRDEERIKGDAAEQMRRLAAIRERESTMPTGDSERLMPPEMPSQLKQVGSPLSRIANAPSPVKPIDYSDMPMGVMGGGDEYWAPGGIKDQQAERSRQWEISKGLRSPEEPPMRIPREPRGGFGPAPTSPLARAGLLSQVPGATLNNPMIVEKQDYDPGLANLKRASLAQPAARSMAPQDRRAMRADRREMARNIMDQYIAGPRRAMPAPRRAMPVAPRRPMIDRAMIAPAAPPAMYAKGGAVKKGQAKVGKVMGEFKRGELHSGSKQGPLVTNPKQAKAIALSEARAAGAKIPKKAMGGKACG